jgi:2'-5' RNA ligase
MIKATCALLADREIQNEVSRLAWDIHIRWATGLVARRIPAHVSLKQPFRIDHNLLRFERYVKEFARRTEPFLIELDGFFVWPTVFGMAVRESSALRALHNFLNTELAGLFDDVTADFDGDAYQFHMTVTTSGTSPATYLEIQKAYANMPFRRSFQARELAIFVYDLRADGSFDFMMHTVLLLGSTNIAVQ